MYPGTAAKPEQELVADGIAGGAQQIVEDLSHPVKNGIGLPQDNPVALLEIIKKESLLSPVAISKDLVAGGEEVSS